MDDKISLEAIALYSDAYSDKVLKNYFASHEKISGSEILSLCNVQQINLFVIRELFKAWKEENQKLKSHYFDYDHPTVKEAFETFMGVLSKHISIDQAHFAPLLKKAVSQTVLIIFSPYDYFSILVTGKHNKLEVISFREELKYLKLNRAPLEKLLQTLELRNVLEIPGMEAFGMLDQILEEVNFNPEDVEAYIEKFSAILPLHPEKFYTSRPEVPKNNIQEKKITEPVRPAVQPMPAAAQPATTTINDRHTTEVRPTLADNFKKIARIKDSLTINQKFMFTKVLFHGDFELFSQTVEDLDRQDNLKGAMRFLEENYEEWDKESEEFHEFMELIEMRFR